MLKEVVNTKERCPRCGRGKLVTDTESGELFCSKCGFVMSEKLQESGPEWRSFTQDEHGDRARAGAPTSLTMHDMGLATIINPMNKDAAGRPLTASMKSTIERLRTWDSRSQVHEQVDRNFRQAFSELNRLKDKLAISDAVIEKSAYIYRKALDKGLVRGRSISALMAAALYAACRDTATPRNLKDVAITVLKSAQEIEISAGKDPMGLAAAALYLSCVKNGEDKTQRDIAESANVTEVTIRNRYKGLKELLNL